MIDTSRIGPFADLQLIHPKNGKPYFRAPANESTDDNLESLPEF